LLCIALQVSIGYAEVAKKTPQHLFSGKGRAALSVAIQVGEERAVREAFGYSVGPAEHSLGLTNSDGTVDQDERTASVMITGIFRTEFIEFSEQVGAAYEIVDDAGELTYYLPSTLRAAYDDADQATFGAQYCVAVPGEI
jgi:hypothetical protein